MGGQCQRIVIANDQQHALSVGEYGDLVCWDLKSHRPTFHKLGLTQHVTGLALHPTQPLAAVSWTDGHHEGTVQAVNLTTGETTLWLDSSAGTLAFNATGDRLAASHLKDKQKRRATYLVEDLKAQNRKPLWREHWHASDQFDDDLVFQTTDTVKGRQRRNRFKMSNSAISANGKITASTNKQNLQIGKATFPVSQLHHWFANRMVVTNDGAAIVAAGYGPMFVARRADEDRQVFAPHLGYADRLVFSPDGSYLAIMSLRALRIVDLTGNVSITLPGTHIASPGKDGPEFWLASPTGARRWNAATKSNVGERIKWLREGSSLKYWNANQLGDGNPPHRRFRLGIALVVQQHAWLDASGTNTGSRLVKQTHGKWLPIGQAPLEGPIAMRILPGTDDVLLLGSSTDALAESSNMTLYRLDADGNRRVLWRGNGSANWLAVNDTGTTVWITDHERLIGISCKGVREAVQHTTGTNWDSGIAWHDDNLLVTDGKTLQVINPMTLEQVRSFDVPKDLTELDLLAASPDRSHLAIASGSEVRILRLQ
jgi:hypothetical protein